VRDSTYDDGVNGSSLRARIWSALLRGAAAFAGVFLVLGVIAGWRSSALDSTHWLLDLRGLPWFPRSILLLGCGALALWWGTRPPVGRARHLCTAALGALATIAAWDAAQVLSAALRGDFALGLPPLSLGVALILGSAAWRSRRDAPVRLVGVTAAAGGWAAAFALALMACFGTTDYRRPADAVVVLGARAYADGRPSVALADRVRTAAALVRDGHASLLVVSGGPGDGVHHETDVMRRVAEKAGVSAHRIVADRAGLDTRATARNASRLLRERGAGSALVVSHAYHLPRVKSAFDREGFRVFTVPADESRVLLRLPWYVAREAAGWWVYWLRDGVAHSE
jgi:uncharacterized SAM-binding protein YcdF (DUF218 family)